MVVDWPTVARYITLGVSLLGILLWGCIAFKNKSPAMFAATAIWLINLSAFMLARVLMLPIDPYALNYWSIGIHLEGAITITGGALAMIISWRNSDARTT